METKAIELARLVGSFHAHKAAGPEYYAAWHDQLTRRQLGWLGDYCRVGVAMFEWPEFTDLPAAQRDPRPTLAAAIANFGLSMQSAFAGIAAAMTPPLMELAGSINDLAQGFNEAFEDLERLALASELHHAGIPEPAADWLAERWPLGYAPSVLRVRWSNFKYDFSNAARRFPCRLGWHTWVDLEIDAQPFRHCMDCQIIRPKP